MKCVDGVQCKRAGMKTKPVNKFSEYRQAEQRKGIFHGGIEAKKKVLPLLNDVMLESVAFSSIQ